MSSTAIQIEQDRQVMEIWEIQVPGGCRVQRFDIRRQEYVLVKLHGTSGPRRVTLSKDDRIYNQEQIRREWKHLDPFENGTLAQVVDGKLRGVTDEDLAEMLTIRGREFDGLVAGMTNELTARRLYELAQREGTMDQVNALRDKIEDTWRVGGTQPTVAEMMREAQQGGERLG
jgi:hypothetical protein